MMPHKGAVTHRASPGAVGQGPPPVRKFPIRIGYGARSRSEGSKAVSTDCLIPDAHPAFTGAYDPNDMVIEWTMKLVFLNSKVFPFILALE